MAMRPPALVDDAMRAVFTRLPPDDPRSLVRAAAVCWSWRGILSDPGFARGYRAFHGAAPMLGFLHNAYRAGNRFVPTSTFRRRASQDRPDCQVLDSRHGLVLLYAPAYDPPLEARDLVTGNCWDIDADPKCHGIMHWPGDDPEDFFSGTAIHCNATVLCAKGRCDHLDCHGGPFLVALVGAVEEGGIALATVYSSETREWSDMISVQSPGLHIDDGGHTAVVGDMVYVPSYECDSVVEYNIREQQLSVINVPENQGQGFLYLIGVEDGMLLFASVLKPRLYLWSMEAGPRGAAAWARHRVVELEPLLPRRALLDMSSSDVWTAGFAEGVRVIFLRTPVGLHAIELNSGRVNKVHEQGIEKVMPYTSFCTGAWGRLPASNEASRAVVGGGTTV